MPTPRSGETRNEFVSRCMSDPEAKRTRPNRDERLGLCNGLFDQARKSMADKFECGAEVVKVDESLGLVMGFAIVCEEGGEPYFDVQGDHIPEDAMLKASLDFMRNSRTAMEMHAGDGKGSVVFAWPMTKDIAKAFGILTDRTGLMIAVRPDDPEMLEKFKNGTFTGFSIGGLRLEDEEVD